MAERSGKASKRQHVEEIPTFTSEQEEVRYWSEHEASDELLSDMGPVAEDVLPPPRTPARPVSVRFEAQLLDRLRNLASLRGIRYQTLLKQFVLERLYEEEQREGLVRAHRELKPRSRQAASRKRKTSAPPR